MSYIQSQIKCDNCQYEMNVAFGIVGTTQIAGWPNECPECQHTTFTKIADGWQMEGSPRLPSEERK